MAFKYQRQQQVRNAFKDLISECGITLYDTVYHDVDEAYEVDKIAVRETFNNWIDNEHRDGLLTDHQVNNYTLKD